MPSHYSVWLQDWRAWYGNANGTPLEHTCPQLFNGAELPPLDFIPAMQRRRYSRLSKIAIGTAQPLLAENAAIASVFCSRDGELQRTAGLLQQLVAGELLSPTAFSMSVHNTAAGLSAILRGDISPSSTVAGGDDSLAMGFVEAASRLHSGAADRVLLVYADEILPPMYQQCGTGQDLAVAMMLSLQPAQTALTLELLGGQDAVPQNAAVALLQHLLQRRDSTTVAGGRVSWRWCSRVA